MKSFKHIGKYLLSGSIVAATLLSTTNISSASETNADKSKDKNKDDAVAFGNTKNPKMSSF